MIPSEAEIPLLTEFDPQDVNWQFDALEEIRTEYDYSLGVHQILFSGSVGSAKSILGAHIVITHCMENKNAVAGIGRLTMPDLKDTLLDMILKHLGEPGEIIDYNYNRTEGEITFPNGSKILSFSWADKKYKKFRSYAFTMFVIEELTENDTPEAYNAIMMRLGRNRNVKEKILLSMTNPDEPDHWVYKRIIERQCETIHVYYSLTKDNKFLDPAYIEFLETNLDAAMAKRMLEGLWLSIRGNTIYYTYSERNQIRGVKYEIDRKFPIRLSFDFNIGDGKPLSCVFFQWNRDTFFWYAESVIYSARTEDVLEDCAQRGLFDEPNSYIIHGDATGRRRDTRSKSSDYEIIDEYLANYKTKDGKHINYTIEVPRSNPPVRTRHNLMNAQMCNVKGQNSFLVYVDGVPTFHEGIKLTKLKPGGKYIEDDSKYFQHISTAGGYGVCACIQFKDSKPQGTVLL